MSKKLAKLYRTSEKNINFCLMEISKKLNVNKYDLENVILTKSNTKKVEKSDKIILIFYPNHDRDKNKHVKIVSNIKRGDYETFYGLIQEFFRNELEEEELSEIIRLYPELETKIFDKKGNYKSGLSFQDIFNRTFMVDGIEEVNHNEFIVEWYT